MRSAILDIETSALEAIGAGFMLCAVVKPYRKTPRVFRYDDLHCKPAHEKRLIQALVAEIGKYDLLIGHNIMRFDWNYIKSRAIALDVALPYRPLVYDTLHAFRRCGFLTRQNGFGKPTASLAFIVDFLGIPQEKTALYPREHWKGVWETGGAQHLAISNLVAHCKADVEMNERVYEHLLRMDTNALVRRLK